MKQARVASGSISMRHVYSPFLLVIGPGADPELSLQTLSIPAVNGGGEPSGSLRNQINTDFGSFERFQEHFSRAAEQVEGSGWAILVWSPRAHRLEILQAEKHQNLSQQDVIPLLPLDVWEHAYYLKYKNNNFF